MVRKRTTAWLAAGLLTLFLARAAQGQDEPALSRLFAPTDQCKPYGEQYWEPNEGYFFNIHGLHWWIESPERTTIGREGLEREVFYAPEIIDEFTGEVLLPAVTEVQTNTVDTGFLNDNGTSGMRYEFGNISGENGWLVSIFDMHTQGQDNSFTDVPMTFEDPTGFLDGNVEWFLGEFDPPPVVINPGVVIPGTPPIVIPPLIIDPPPVVGYSNTNFIGPLPVRFDEVLVMNKTETWGVEAMYVRRFKPTHGGATFEMFLGPRYLQFDDMFFVDARGTVAEPTEDDDDDEEDDPRFEYDVDGNIVGPGAVLADSHWNTDAENRIIAPQIGLRGWKRYGRLSFNGEGRVFAGWNSQNIEQRGVFGTNLSDTIPFVFESDQLDGFYPYIPAVNRPVAFHNTRHFNEFTPGVELRLSANFHVTKAITLNAGWTGIWMDGIARASNMINYTVPNMGIAAEHNRQSVMMSGLEFGIEINR